MIDDLLAVEPLRPSVARRLGPRHVVGEGPPLPRRQAGVPHAARPLGLHLAELPHRRTHTDQRARERVVGFLHEEGRVWWSRTTLVDAEGRETVVWGDTVELPPEQLAGVKVRLTGLKAGTKVRVLFEDRELTAADGYFVDDFRGQDLYQRHGGGWGTGYGDAPVALHVYEVPTP